MLYQEKCAFLLDVIRRVVANPGNAKKVANTIARDWNPTILVDKNGETSFEMPDPDEPYHDAMTGPRG